MSLTDKLAKGVKQATLGAAIVAAPLAHAQTNPNLHSDSRAPAITQTIQEDFFARYQELKSDLNIGKLGAREAYDSYLIQHYQDIKAQVDNRAMAAEKQFQKDGKYNDAYTQAMDNRIAFNQDMQDQYQRLSILKESDRMGERDQKLLSAISGDSQQKLNQLLQQADSYPKDNPNVHQPFYQMMHSLMKQLDYQQQQCNMHPETRLNVAKTITDYAKLLSANTDLAIIGQGYEINPNKLHSFLDRTGSRIDASNGINIRLNHPDKRQQLGFEFHVDQKDMSVAARSAQVAYDYIKESVNDYEIRDQLMKMMNNIATKPTPDTINSARDTLLNLEKEHQDVFKDPVFTSCIQRATEIPFQVTVHDKNGSRPATKADSEKFLTTLVENIHALDKEGVINLNDIISKAVGKESSFKRGLTSVGFSIANTFSDPIKSFMEKPVKEGFAKMIDLRDKSAQLQESSYAMAKNFSQQSAPVLPPTVGQGSKQIQPLNIPVMIAKNKVY